MTAIKEETRYFDTVSAGNHWPRSRYIKSILVESPQDPSVGLPPAGALVVLDGYEVVDQDDLNGVISILTEAFEELFGDRVTIEVSYEIPAYLQSKLPFA